MKKFFVTLVIALCGVAAMAQKQAEIKFETDSISLGTFSEKDGVQEVAYPFTNIGNAPLVLHQVVATCGCTVPDYEKRAIAPGDSSVIKVTYNGRGKLLGQFTKVITVRSNAKNGILRLFLTGDMTQ